MTVAIQHGFADGGALRAWFFERAPDWLKPAVAVLLEWAPSLAAVAVVLALLVPLYWLGDRVLFGVRRTAERILEAIAAARARNGAATDAAATDAAAALRVAQRCRRAARLLRRCRLESGYDVLAEVAAKRCAQAARRPGDIADAVQYWRDLGALARGVDTARARAACEEAFQMDSEDIETCVQLARVRRDSGDMPGALGAARRAERLARTDRERSVALDMVGRLLLEAGDGAGATASFAQSLAAKERLAAANPDGAEEQRDLASGHGVIAGILVQAGDFGEATTHYVKCAAIHERLANDGDARGQRDLATSLNRLGNVLVQAGDLAGAKARFEAALAARERLAASIPGSATAQRDLSSGHTKLGEVLVATGQIDAAKAHFEQSLEIDERLVAANPSDPQAQRDLAVSCNKLADMARLANDVGASVNLYRSAWAVVVDLRAHDPGNVKLEIDQIELEFRLAQLAEDAQGVAAAEAALKALHARGAPFPRQDWMGELEKLGGSA